MANLFTVNHSEAGGVFEPLPIQEYECVVSEAKIGKSKGANTAGCDQLELQLTIREDIDQPGQKRKFFDTIIFAPSLAWKIQQLFKACAFEDGKTFTDIADVARAVAYRSIRVKNKHETYNDKTRDRVDYYTESKSPLSGVGAPGAQGFDPFNTTPSAANTSNPFDGAMPNPEDDPF